MNTQRAWFLIIGLIVGLLLAGGAYFLWPAHQTIIVTPVSPPASVKAPLLSQEEVPAPIAVPVPLPQPQGTSGPTATYLYNAQGQLQAITYPDGSVYSYQYDAYGNKIRETGRTGKTWTYAYDQNHHPLSVIDPEGRVTHKEASPSPPNAN